MQRKALYIVTTAAVLVLAVVGVWFIANVAGCGDGNGHVNGNGEAQPATNMLTLYGIDPWTLDPAVASDATSHSYIVQIFSGLLKLGDELEPAGDIAERWEMSADGTVYTFYLRQDVYFQDGRRVTADDFKYSWERACDPATNSRTAGLYLNDIIGAEDVMDGTATEISGVRVLDEFTLQVTIDSPKSYFLSKLTYPTAFVVDSNNVAEGGEWWRQPNGTGPFKLHEWRDNDVFALSRYDGYYGQVAQLDYAVFLLWGGVTMNMYELGEIDVTTAGTDYVPRVTDEAGPFYDQLSIVPELSFYYVGFNAEEPPFDDPDIRRAFSLAIDKEKLISLVFAGTMQTAEGVLPPGIPGYNPDVAGLGYDVDAALELIANSSYGSVENLPPITLTTAGWGGLISEEIEALAVQWRDNLGVEITVRQLDPQIFLYHLDEEKDEMFYSGWVADYPHPQDFLEVLFGRDAENNYGGYDNPDYEALLAEAAAETDSEAGLELYRQAEQMLVDDAACIPLCFGRHYLLVKPYVKGYNLNPQGFAMLNEVWLDSN
ncbi:MAG: peptide ABC transporter substrate-binding protein [Dehalococcoidia bacterium]|jgi:oligopeptide transport system substrate-binding protein